MQQHPIPQNILDIEFKLFGRFTVKEFAYLALGVGFGGIFLFFFTKGLLPGIIAIPVFLFSSGVGVGLAVVPINDQKADTFIKNYLSAITKPTLRVWKNSLFDEKVEWEAEQRGLTLAKNAGNKPITSTSTKPEIVGGGTELGKTQFIEESKLQELDEEERQKLDKIEKLAAEASALEAKQDSGAQEDQSATIHSQQSIASPESTQTTTEKAIPVEESASIVQENSSLSDQMNSKYGQSPIEPSTTAQIETPAEIGQKSNGSDPGLITISSGNNAYSVNIDSFQPVPNSINLVIQNSQSEPVQQAMIITRDSGGKIVQVNQSNAQGYVLPNKPYNPGEYIVEIRHDKYNFPKLRVLLDNQSQKPILVKPLT
ncbi:PrgI family protein [Candidatus Dojkabacteria bacterium]|uniref:PrgI family protein n=1 Tax=Candidatus Dojkabacteria bacterium TaxID=2099670 RepID=A0A955KV95_9BACT|nr:PrgI family protein [Candidatus Dojkabacteria bacterium]MCB9790987.1 PrgI family protein [Candidatus Nomurabacteria bacterium]